MLYRFTEVARALSPQEMWERLENGLSHNLEIKSLTETASYLIQAIEGGSIYYERLKSGVSETISSPDFMWTMEMLKAAKKFNTSWQEPPLQGSPLHRYKGPLFGILKAAGWIEPTEG